MGMHSGSSRARLACAALGLGEGLRKRLQWWPPCQLSASTSLLPPHPTQAAATPSSFSTGTCSRRAAQVVKVTQTMAAVAVSRCLQACSRQA